MDATFDLLIRNACVVDGTGAARFDADIGVRADRIERIGELSGARGRLEIDLAGRIAAPGFIDCHTHDDRLLLSHPEMTPKVSQGVTTVIGGNCGISLAPMPRPIPAPVTPPLDLLDGAGGWFRFPDFASYLEALRTQPAATNCAMLLGHSTLRVATMDDLSRPATGAEIAAMRALVREGLQAGAKGVSTGLFYEPAAAAPTEEVIEVCRPLAEFGGIYCTHMRDEADRVIESIEETLAIGRALGVPVVISHHKVMDARNFGRTRETLALIESGSRSQRVCLDCYPYDASSTILTERRAAATPRVLVGRCDGAPEFAGRELDDIAREMGVTRAQAVRRLQPASGIYFRMDESDVRRVLQFPVTMIGSDGLPHDTSPHPRLWGSFVRVLGHYSRDLHLFPLETAVHKMTGLTAANFGLADRGVLREGACADLVLFDAATVGDGATYAEPTTPARGIAAVFVNGVPVWRDGHPTGERPGRVLSHVGG